MPAGATLAMAAVQLAGRVVKSPSMTIPLLARIGSSVFTAGLHESLDGLMRWCRELRMSSNEQARKQIKSTKQIGKQAEDTRMQAGRSDEQRSTPA